MKFAIQLFGHSRTFNKCYSSLFTNLINEYDCDIFIHTWSNKDYTISKNENYCDELTNSLTEAYKPISLTIEDQPLIKSNILINDDHMLKNKGFLSSSLQGFKHMLHSMRSVNTQRSTYQKKNNIEYDFVIILRPDILLQAPFDISLYIREFEYAPNTVLSFIDKFLIMFNESRYDSVFLTSDLFLLLKPDVADAIFNNNSDNFLKYPQIFPKTGFCAEKLFQEYLDQNNIIRRYYQFPYSIIRLSKKHSTLGINSTKSFHSVISDENEHVKLSKKIKKYRSLFKMTSLSLIILTVVLIIIFLKS